LLVTQAFNQLFLVVDRLPATVPPAVVMLALGAWRRRTPVVLAEPAVRPCPPAPASGRARC
jgi:hypothetical protein